MNINSKPGKRTAFRLKNLVSALCGAGVVSSALITAGAVHAAATPMSIATSPLEGQQSAAPNVIVVQDDSGSMDWEVSMDGKLNSLWNQPDSDEGAGGNACTASTKPGCYVVSDTSSFGTSSAHTLGSFFDAVNSACTTSSHPAPIKCATAGWNNMWAVRTTGFNKLYYNPAVKYDPWPGYNSSGVAYPKQTDIANVLYDPTVDLTTKVNLSVEYTLGGNKKFYIPHYYDASYSGTSAGVTSFNNTAKTIVLSSVAGVIPGQKLYGDGIGNSYSKTATGVNGKNYLVLGDVANIEIGQAVIGTGVPTGTHVQGLYTASKTVILNRNLTAAVSGSVKFNNGALVTVVTPATKTLTVITDGSLAPATLAGVFFGPKPVVIDSATTSFAGSAARTDCANPLACTSAEELKNFANWFAYYRARHQMAKGSIGEVISKRQSVRIGLQFINAGVATNVLDMERDPTAANNKGKLLTKLYSNSPSGGTPLRTALYTAGNTYNCTPGVGACPLQAGLAACQSNYALLTTDGYWNDSWSNGSVADRDSATSGVGSEYAGKAFAGSSASNTLADVAMYFYDHDLATTINNEVPVTDLDKTRVDQRDTVVTRTSHKAVESTYNPDYPPLKSARYMHQHMKTYTVGFGVGGDIPLYKIKQNFDTAIVDNTTVLPNPWTAPGSNRRSAVDDLAHAAYNGRGQYLNAADPVALKSGLNDMFDSFLEGTGTASAATFNSQTIETGGYQYRTTFNMSNKSGDVEAYEIDTATGDIKDANPATTDVDPKWKFSTSLNNLSDVTSRKIYTWSGTAGKNFDWSSISSDTAVTSNGLDTQAEVDYLRGDRTNETPAPLNFRKRVSRLGDIVHSAAYFLGDPHANHPGDASYATFAANYGVTKDIRTGISTGTARAKTLFVGANDGMLHAIDAGTGSGAGSERWAYIPRRLLTADPDTSKSSSLSDFIGVDYSHRYYVDAAPQIEDVKYGSYSGSSDWMNWKTVLVGGLGVGGKSLYAIDVTQPDQVTASKVLWEVSNETTGYTGNLGFTYGEPLIGRISNKWYAIVGNGYNSENGKAGLFLIEIEPASGKPKTTIFLEASAIQQSDGSANGMGPPRGVDYNGDGNIDYLYAGDMNGVLYRFKMPGDDNGDGTPDAPTTSNVKIYGVYQAFYDRGTPQKNQPIMTAPIVVPNLAVSGELIVVFATGSWVSTTDATSTDVQSIYGVRDVPNGTANQVTNTSTFAIDSTRKGKGSGSTALQQQSYSSFTSGTVSGYTLSNNSVNLTQGLGWYNDLTATKNGERVIARMRLVGTDPTSYYVAADTMLPKSATAGASCKQTTDGHFIIFSPMTGGLPGPVFYNPDGSLMSKVNDQYVAGFDRQDGLTSSQYLADDQRRYQVGDKDYTGIESNLAKNTGWVSWRELTK